MALPLRIEMSGGWYHVMGRGNERKAIFGITTIASSFSKRLEIITRRFGRSPTPEGFATVSVEQLFFLHRAAEGAGVVVHANGSERWQDFQDRHGDFGRDRYFILPSGSAVLS